MEAGRKVVAGVVVSRFNAALNHCLRHHVQGHARAAHMTEAVATRIAVLVKDRASG